MKTSITTTVRPAPSVAAAALLVFGLMLQPGCASGPAASHAKGGTHAGIAPVLVDVPPPPGLDAVLVTPRTGAEKDKANLSLEQIVAKLPLPAYLTPAAASQPATQPAATQPANAEPPVAAQRAYLAARLAWRERRNFEAINQLQSALRLAPRSPEILSLLGQIYTNSGNKPRGAYYLQQAVQIDPTDEENLFLLGRYALEQKNATEAIVILSAARKLEAQSADADPALWPLLDYYLGTALAAGGYDAAAIGRYTDYLNLPEHFGRTTRLYRELSFLYRQRGATWQGVGDAYHRLNFPKEALTAYRSAAELGVDDQLALARRVVYTQLRLGDVNGARQQVVEQLRLAKADANSIALARYLTGHGVNATELAATLTSIYQESDKPAALAIVIADLLGPDKGRAILEQHLAAKPNDRAVYEVLIRRTLGLDSATPAPGTGPIAAPKPEAITAAIRVAGSVIAKNPEGAEPSGVFLIEAVRDPAAMLQGFDRLTPQERTTPVVRYLHGLSLARARRNEPAADEFRQAMDGSSGLVAARIALAKYLVGRGRFDQAAQVIEPLGDRTDADVIGLRVRVLSETGKAEQATALLDQMIAKQPDNIDLVLDKAGLQLRRRDSLAAERTLLDALNTHPDAEKIYEALFNLYDMPQGPPDSNRQYQRLMYRMLGALPNSRVARLRFAEWLAVSHQNDQAEQVLRGLLTEDSRDFQALGLLLQLYVQAGRKDDAQKLLTDRLAATPNDEGLLLVGVEYYGSIQDRPHEIELRERLLTLLPPDQLRAQVLRDLSQLYLDSEQPDKAIQALTGALKNPGEFPEVFLDLLGKAYAKLGRFDDLDKAFTDGIARFPDKAADIGYNWAMAYEGVDRHDRAEQILQQVLDKHPDHAYSANALGYAWANSGRNLDRALKLLEVAVKDDPNSAAYLDSMGWVHYKLGRFDDAVTWLGRARVARDGENPVILDHLGDALYRKGDKDGSMEAWRSSQEGLSRIDPARDPELKGLGERLRAKIEGTQHNRSVPVADVPGHADDAKPAQDPRHPAADEAGAKPVATAPAQP